MSKRWWVLVGVAAVMGGAVWWGMDLRQPDASETAVQAALGFGPRAESSPALNRESPSSPASVVAVPEPAPTSRFQLFRVLKGPAGSQGVDEAVIGVDGLPPKAYRMGSAVVGAVVLQSVQPTGATLGPANGPAAVVLGLSPPTASAGAVLQPSNGDQPAVRAASSPPVNRTPVIVSDPDHGVDETNR